MSNVRKRSVLAAIGAAALLIAVAPWPAPAQETAVYNPPLRVCADPNNMPFSNRQKQGFENKLARMIAEDLDTTVAYTWHPQRRGFLRETLFAYECDVVMGVPKLDGIKTTRSYYRSSYVYVTRKDRDLDFSSMKAPQLKALTIGVHLVGDDGANTPPEEALAEQGLIDNVAGYSIYGDYSENSPPLALVKAVAQGEVDIAAMWGPAAGYYAQQSDVPLRLVPITDTVDYLPYTFDFPISMGVRSGDDVLLDRLNRFIRSHQDEIDELLASYGVPLT